MTWQILVADDDLIIRNLLKECLELQNYSVILAGNGQEAISLAKIYHPHLLISDIIMPLKNGFELVKELRDIKEFELLPVIFLTNKDGIQDRVNGYQAGCDIYLEKPFNPPELIAIIKHLFTRHNVQLSQTKSDVKLDISLTNRERQVLRLLIKGFSNLRIGEELYLSSKTVEKYVSNLLRKTGSTNRTELASFACKNKII
ncbi:response regulator transcription factor [Cyanobacterium aponinum UTEX 3222]|uniref:Two component transcriptional regulator, LuxR family n=3 Tax=Cyanobacterium aponinum TaxID=379064 RepID=K9Z356_CYAAP|nr:response regulator transcription factor [Cyanobacterium aponinum]WRL41122.1 response regulator transcription factor [Cyanobacterium aponinum UTEX 3222]AFZ53152.1 two component transcriptional regulator, LuxR family [Cyanobacterium aponinum PCC 10605]MBD2395418.1 response regulator transcription factor [Cyanobacterium aponinum FACHB-4101]MTF40439.1 response regulator [Cyanobacterium aponinum 0216]PHV64156.1 DNA-binding response regulator [Cyanobacterium aponinum IPPAS B-1201]